MDNGSHEKSSPHSPGNVSGGASAFEAERREIDREMLALIARRFETYKREASHTVNADPSISHSLGRENTKLAELLVEGARLGLGVEMVENIFSELSASGLAEFSKHLTSVLNQGSSSSRVVKNARQRGIPIEASTILFSSLPSVEDVILDDREVSDLKSVIQLLRDDSIRYGFIRYSLDRFDDLAFLVETLVASKLTIVARASRSDAHEETLSHPPLRVEGVEGKEEVLLLAKDFPFFEDGHEGLRCWWTWIFLKVPEARSVRSTDLLIRALMLLRKSGIDTSHINSLPGLSYEGFSYRNSEATTSEAPALARSSGSRSFLIDVRRSPSSEVVERALSELIEMGCSGQIICCIPLPDSEKFPSTESPIHRRVATLST